MMRTTGIYHFEGEYMNIDEMNRLVRKGEMIPANALLIEQVYMQGIRYILAEYEAGRISREQASSERNALEREFLRWKLWERMYCDIARVRVELGFLMRDAETGDCERCRKMVRVLDGRIRLERE